MRKEIVMTLANGVQVAVHATMSPSIAGNEQNEGATQEVALNYVLFVLRCAPASMFSKAPEIQAARD